MRDQYLAGDGLGRGPHVLQKRGFEDIELLGSWWEGVDIKAM